MNNGLKVLLVDDQEFNLEILELMLTNSYNAKVSKASNGQEAIDQVILQDLEDGFDIIFMDIAMPIMDGFTSSVEIRKLFETKQIKRLPIICALSA